MSSTTGVSSGGFSPQNPSNPTADNYLILVYEAQRLSKLGTQSASSSSSGSSTNSTNCYDFSYQCLAAAATMYNNQAFQSYQSQVSSLNTAITTTLAPFLCYCTVQSGSQSTQNPAYPSTASYLPSLYPPDPSTWSTTLYVGLYPDGPDFESQDTGWYSYTPGGQKYWSVNVNEQMVWYGCMLKCINGTSFQTNIGTQINIAGDLSSPFNISTAIPQSSNASPNLIITVEGWGSSEKLVYQNAFAMPGSNETDYSNMVSKYQDWVTQNLAPQIFTSSIANALP